MSINFKPTFVVFSDNYASQYAKTRNISAKEANQSLKIKYSNPEQINIGLVQGSNESQPTTIDSFEYSEDEYNEIFGNDKFDFNNILQGLIDFFSSKDDKLDNKTNNNDISGINGAQNQDPDTYAQQYADENGISLEDAKEQLKSMYGDPQER